MNRHSHVHGSCVGKFLYQGPIEHECNDSGHYAYHVYEVFANGSC